VLIQPIGADTDWSPAALGAVFSGVLLITGVGGILAGGRLDHIGEQPLLLLAAVFGAGGMLVASYQSALLPFAIAYAGGCGLVGALGFYHITQSIAARAAPAAPARAIIWLTLIGAFAGPIFLPATGWLVEAFGWRATIRVEAATVAVAFVLTAVLVKDRGGTPRTRPTESSIRALRLAWRRPRLRAWLFATLISGAAVDALLVYQVPVMVRIGLPLGIAASIAGFRGLSQLAGRLPLVPLLRRLGARNTIVLAYIVAAATTPLLFLSGTLALALAFALFVGASTGALAALQGIYTHELVDRRHLGTMLGTQQALFEVGGAAGPAIGGVLLAVSGSYTPMILVVVIGFVAAACVLLLGSRRPEPPTDPAAP
jgi:predicted MFS family arabinose efflux permease